MFSSLVLAYHDWKCKNVCNLKSPSVAVCTENDNPVTLKEEYFRSRTPHLNYYVKNEILRKHEF